MAQTKVDSRDEEADGKQGESTKGRREVSQWGTGVAALSVPLERRSVNGAASVAA